MQANVAVIGTGVGVLSFATREGCLPFKSLIAAAATAQRLRLLDRPATNENNLEIGLSERSLKVAGMTQRHP
jgi:hypothetical protein